MPTETAINTRLIDRARLAHALRQAMDVRGLDQYDLSKLLGVSQPTVHHWLSETKQPGAKNLGLVLDAFDIKWEDVCKQPHHTPKTAGTHQGHLEEAGRTT